MGKRGWGKGWWAISISIVFLIAVVSPARAGVSAGGQRLVDIQNPEDGTWFFKVGDPKSGKENVIGVTGLGLLAAFEKTNDQAFLDAALKAGNHLVGVFNANTSDRPFPQDIEFLMGLSQVSAVAEDLRNTFRDTARQWLRNTTHTSPTPKEPIGHFVTPKSLIDHFVAVRDAQGQKTLALWDVAAVIRAAFAVGNYTIPKDLTNDPPIKKDIKVDNTQFASRVASRAVSPTVFNQVGEETEDGVTGGAVFSPFEATLLGRASLLFSLRGMGRGPGGTVREYREFLLNNQDGDGSWSEGHTQITSYAILGLSADRDRLTLNKTSEKNEAKRKIKVQEVRKPTGEAVQAAIDGGGNFLEEIQFEKDPDKGGFPAFVLDGLEYSAIDSEATQALAGAGGGASKRAKAAVGPGLSRESGMRAFPSAPAAMPIK